MTRRVASGLAAAAAAGILAGHASARPTGCPAGLAPLGSPPTHTERAAARSAVLGYVRDRYAPPRTLVTDRMFVAEELWVARWRHGGFVASSCGAAVSLRTLAVTVVFPVMYDEPSPASARCGYCARATFLVSKAGRAWLVWYVL